MNPNLYIPCWMHHKAPTVLYHLQIKTDAILQQPNWTSGPTSWLCLEILSLKITKLVKIDYLHQECSQITVGNTNTALIFGFNASHSSSNPTRISGTTNRDNLQAHKTHAHWMSLCNCKEPINCFRRRTESEACQLVGKSLSAPLSDWSVLLQGAWDIFPELHVTLKKHITNDSQKTARAFCISKQISFNPQHPATVALFNYFAGGMVEGVVSKA